MDSLEALIQWLTAQKPSGATLLEYEPMSRHTSFRVGGPIRAMLVCDGDPAGLGPVLKKAGELGVVPLFIGNGSNLLAPDEGLDALAIKTTASALTRDGDMITAQSGTPMARLAVFAMEHGLTGLEFAHGIPGTVGGGITMNAGAYGGELKDRVVSVAALDPEGNERVFSNEECGFSYRHSLFSEGGWYITRVKFRLAPGDREAIRAHMKELADKRREKQPLEWPSAGSTFKRPAGHFAAALIDECGLKGLRIGGAQVSEKHAGFVVNVGGATCRDIRALMEQVKAKVREQTGVELEPEVKLLGG